MSELADIQLKFGYDHDAILMMRKTFDECNAQEDQYTMARKVMLTAFETGNYNFQSDYSDRALDRDPRQNSVETGILQILNAHAYGRTDVKLMARKFSAMQIVSIDGVPELEMLPQETLAYYVVLSCLSSLTRAEIRESVITNSSILSMLETIPDTNDILDNFMMGRYEAFQRQLNKLQKKLKYDQFFGEHRSNNFFKKIRTLTLQQYVKPFKVIDMREISTAFGLPLEVIETELTELITSGQIKAKIDSYQKRLYARKQNPQLEAYKKAAQVGQQFIRDTEDMLLKINLMKNNQVLDLKDKYQMQKVMSSV